MSVDDCEKLPFPPLSFYCGDFFSSLIQNKVSDLCSMFRQCHHAFTCSVGHWILPTMTSDACCREKALWDSEDHCEHKLTYSSTSPYHFASSKIIHTLTTKQLPLKDLSAKKQPVRGITKMVCKW